MRAVAIALLVVGCSDGTDRSGPGDPDRGVECGEQAPVIETLSITNNGLYTFGTESASEEWPSLLIEAEVVDEDGALDAYVFDAWYDHAVDEQVDTSGTPFRIADSLSAVECSVTHATLRLILAVNGNPPANTLVEFAVRVIDAEGVSSELALAATQTPLENGDDPD